MEQREERNKEAGPQFSIFNSQTDILVFPKSQMRENNFGYHEKKRSRISTSLSGFDLTSFPYWNVHCAGMMRLLKAITKSQSSATTYSWSISLDRRLHVRYCVPSHYFFHFKSNLGYEQD